MCKRLHLSGKSIPQGRLFRNRRVFSSNIYHFRPRGLYVPVRRIPVPRGGRGNAREAGAGPERTRKGGTDPKDRGSGTARRTVPARGGERPQDIDDPDARKQTGESGPPAAFFPPEQRNFEENPHSVYRVQGKYNKKSNKYKKIIKHVRTLFFVVVNVSGVPRDVKKGPERRKILHIVLAKSAKREYTFPR